MVASSLFHVFSSTSTSLMSEPMYLNTLPVAMNVKAGTVTFFGGLAQIITTGDSNWNDIVVTNASGSVTFADVFTCSTFTCTAPGAHLNFKYKETSGEKIVITEPGGLRLEGDSGGYVYLRRYQGTDPDRWDIYPSGGSWTVNYVDVKDSFNYHPAYINPSNSVDSGNNLNWFTMSFQLGFADLILQNIDIQDDTPAPLSVTPWPGRVRPVE